MMRPPERERSATIRPCKCERDGESKMIKAYDLYGHERESLTIRVYKCEEDGGSKND